METNETQMSSQKGQHSVESKKGTLWAMALSACFTYVEETGIKSVSLKANSKQQEEEEEGYGKGRQD